MSSSTQVESEVTLQELTTHLQAQSPLVDELGEHL